MSMLDHFVKTPAFAGRVRAMPLGVVLHVTAGNVFLSSIDSLIMGLLTKNLSILKVSSQNTLFPMFFAQQLKMHDQNRIIADKFAILHWKGGDTEIENKFKQNVDAIIAWGGEEMVKSYKKDLPGHVKFLEFGPKVSFQLITKDALNHKNLSKIADQIVADILPWNQMACSSPQNLFLQDGVEIFDELIAAFKRAPKRSAISSDEAVEILKEFYRGEYSQVVQGLKVYKGEDFLLHEESDKFLRSSPLNRSLIIKRFTDEVDLAQHLSPFKYYLQSCSYLLTDGQKDEYLPILGSVGVKRFAPLGSVTFGLEGAPHDGKQVMRELTHLISDEIRVMDYGDDQLELTSPTNLKSYFNAQTQHPSGYIFSSGGTTGEPKYVHFSYEEFDFITDMIAENFRAQGLKSGMTVANLFVAGNLWSSFLAVEKALEKIGAIQLPIGGLCDAANICNYLEKFRPDAVMGIPSMLVLNAQFSSSKEKRLNIPMVFYAGEGLSEIRRQYLAAVWGVKHFGSAGYASVDAGIIGYQCSDCSPGEHHLFSDLVEMRIVDEEAVVTSKFRTTMPIKNYRTGDKVEWISPCSCGRKDPRFKLLGRSDNTILIWSCRVSLDDIDYALKTIAPEVKTFQVKLDHDGHQERMNLIVEGIDLKHEENLKQFLFDHSRDLKDTISFEDFKNNFTLSSVDLVSRNPRTGKVSQLVDLRH